MTEVLSTIFGRFAAESKRRLDLTFDYETCAIRSFRDIAAHIGATQILDIGANIGVYSIYTADLRTVREVHAFEPAPDTNELLRKNISIHQNARAIQAYPIALSDRAGEVKFNIVAPMSGANRIATDEDTSNTITVRAARLDDVLGFSGQTVAIKIDVEGHELSTVKGAERFLSTNRCFLQVECLKGHSAAALTEALSGLGYKHLFNLNHDHLYIHRDYSTAEKPFLDIVAKHLAEDLADLTALRLEKRSLAREAKKLWVAAGYKKDPLL